MNTARPVLPCLNCKTEEYVWAEPTHYGEGGRYVRYAVVCEKCGMRLEAPTFSGFETQDEAMRAWNYAQRPNKDAA